MKPCVDLYVTGDSIFVVSKNEVRRRYTATITTPVFYNYSAQHCITFYYFAPQYRLTVELVNGKNEHKVLFEVIQTL